MCFRYSVFLLLISFDYTHYVDNCYIKIIPCVFWWAVKCRVVLSDLLDDSAICNVLLAFGFRYLMIIFRAFVSLNVHFKMYSNSLNQNYPENSFFYIWKPKKKNIPKLCNENFWEISAIFQTTKLRFLKLFWTKPNFSKQEQLYFWLGQFGFRWKSSFSCDEPSTFVTQTLFASSPADV